ncbi:MAG: hypothetical protein H7Y17_11710 [Chlorobia bacterium]|nr:hypothetical protein [Fimbriimonadaceae bacterium]
MIFTAIVAALTSTSTPIVEDVHLARTYKLGEKSVYQIRSNLAAQRRSRGLQTWIPEDFDMNYQFTTEVKALKPEGVVDVLYLRPTMTMITGETFDRPPKTDIEKVKFNLLMTMSPANEILNIKDLNPPPKTPKPKSGGGTPMLRLTSANYNPVQIPFIGQFISEVHRLSLFAGDLQSALDFSPRLPFEKLKVGDTWKRTVGYSPQKLKGKDGKTVNQRLDYVYTYKGLIDSNGKKVYRVEATCGLDTNLADYVNQLFELKPEDTGLKSIPLKFKSTIEFDLDQTTKKTLQANARSEGGFQIILTDLPTDPVEEETFKGRTNLRLVSTTIVKTK